MILPLGVKRYEDKIKCAYLLNDCKCRSDIAISQLIEAVCALRLIHRTRLSSNGETSKFNYGKADKDLRDNTNYNIASRAAQSNSVYVSVLKIPIVHADSVSKSLRQNFFPPLLAAIVKLKCHS